MFHQGDPANHIFQVISGEVHLLREGADGQKILLHRAQATQFFAEASVDARVYHCTALCILDTEVLAFESARLLSLIENNAQFARFWVSHLSRELRRQRSSVERLSLNSAESRLLHYLMAEGSPPGEIDIQGTLSDLADMLGLTRETLYRTLSRLKKSGTVIQQGSVLKWLGHF